MSELDKKDLEIFRILKENADLTTQQISRKTGIPITTVHNRIKKMEDRGVIERYTIVPNYKKLGKKITAFILVNIEYPRTEKKFSQESVAEEISKYGQVEEVSIITGENDIILKVRMENVDELNQFLTQTLREIEGVDKTETMVVLNELKF